MNNSKQEIEFRLEHEGESDYDMIPADDWIYVRNDGSYSKREYYSFFKNNREEFIMEVDETDVYCKAAIYYASINSYSETFRVLLTKKLNITISNCDRKA